MRPVARLRAGVLVVTFVALSAGCAGPARVAPAVAGSSPSPSATARPQTASATPAVAAAAATPRPTSASSPSPSTPVWYPWLPPATSGVDGALEVDTFVTGLIDVLPISPAPGAEPWRFNTGDPDPSTWPLMGVQGGAALVVTHGPVLVDAAEWYLVTPAQLAVDVPTGWTRREALDGTRRLGPSDLPCPGNPATAAEVGARQLTDGLAACYGTEDVVITGELSCDPTPDEFVIGPSWLAGGTCRLEGMFGRVYGLHADTAPGTYAVTGHFNDPEAAACTDPDPAADPDGQRRLQAVLNCRRSFVATAIEPA